ncbi:MAG: hypothetical protein IKJ37_05075 [Kiritimatiellae bacterium]|nr:hypothetical protein [Kiritimatiellia bacterium]
MGERCCAGRPKGGTAFRRLRPPIALAIASRQPLTGAPNECHPQGGFPKTPLAQRYAERARGADWWLGCILALPPITCPLV